MEAFVAVGQRETRRGKIKRLSVAPEIEEHDFATEELEGIFEINEVAAHLALKTGLAEYKIRARIIEAYGYCVRPPKKNWKLLMTPPSKYEVDTLAIRAMQRVVYDFVSAAEVKQIIHAYLGAECGDAYDAADQINTHEYIVIAVLNNLRDEERLPLHPSHFFGA